ncbi:SHOCT domain-containing protein [Kitasatospora sp. NPDC085895]|uniref:SHOCT domain-containing protein n=1 Tax=Kitasatospora sp. NPDC085895 TaxID=3155057 RepID=UPI00344EA05F
MDTLLAHADGHWPGPWILLIPFFWAAVILLVVLILRRTVWRRGYGPGGWHHGGGPLATLGDRYARGEIDEDEYRAKRAVLTERTDRTDRPGGAK